jgi:signal peptidase I
LPKIQKIKRNDIVTFNWPADTVRQFFVREKGVKKPIDKKSNYVKRCVGIPGDTLEIFNGELRINGDKSILPYRAKPLFKYIAYNSKGISSQKLNQLGLYDFQRKFRIKNITQKSFDDIKTHILSLSDNNIENFTIITNSKGIPTEKIRKNRLSIAEITEKTKRLTLTESDYKNILSSNVVDSIVRDFNKTKSYNTAFFPNNITFDWNEDNFGPIVIPKKNQTTEINLTNLPLYKKIIKDYEKNDLKILDDKIFINDKETDNYKFKMDYYWMMGDNRYSSEDSRMWGFVPEDHIVGRPIFIWMSIDGINDGIKNWSIRWDRVFTTIHEDGEPRSYLVHFIIFCFILWLFNKYLLDKLIKNG